MEGRPRDADKGAADTRHEEFRSLHARGTLWRIIPLYRHCMKNARAGSKLSGGSATRKGIRRSARPSQGFEDEVDLHDRKVAFILSPS